MSLSQSQVALWSYLMQVLKQAVEQDEYHVQDLLDQRELGSRFDLLLELQEAKEELKLRVLRMAKEQNQGVQLKNLDLWEKVEYLLDGLLPE